MHVKWKIFDWYVKNYNILSIFTLFQLLLWSLFAFLKMALWFHFSENGPIDISANGNILLIKNATTRFCSKWHPNDIKLFNSS